MRNLTTKAQFWSNLSLQNYIVKWLVNYNWSFLRMCEVWRRVHVWQLGVELGRRAVCPVVSEGAGLRAGTAWNWSSWRNQGLSCTVRTTYHQNWQNWVQLDIKQQISPRGVKRMMGTIPSEDFKSISSQGSSRDFGWRNRQYLCLKQSDWKWRLPWWQGWRSVAWFFLSLRDLLNITSFRFREKKKTFKKMTTFFNKTSFDVVNIIVS